MGVMTPEARPGRGLRYQLDTGLGHLTTDERAVRGKTARTEVPRENHAIFDPPSDRPDPVALLEEQSACRVPELVPVRYGRMMVSPFTFFRGRRAADGRRPGGHAGIGPCRAGLRRRAPVELRRLRLPRTAPGLRHQRLRRDPARPVGVGRQAAGRQPGGRRPRQRLPAGTAPQDRHRGRSAGTARRCAVRGRATSTSGTPGPTSRSPRAVRVPAQRPRAKRSDQDVAKAQTRDSLQALAS